MSGLAPLTLAQLGGLLALTFGALAWLYLRTPSPLRMRVPFLAAWDEVAPLRAASPVRWALVRSKALLRALLFVTLIGVALMDPQPSWLVGPERTTLVVLDAGAHMRATDERPSRFERARELAHDLIAWRLAGSGEVAMVAQLDSALTPLTGWSRDPQQLRAALSSARVSQEPTRFSGVAEFARVQLRGKRNPELIVITDGAFVAAPAELAALRDAGIALRQIRVGQSAANVAIRAFAVRAYPWDAERCEAMVEVENTDALPRAVELTLYEESSPIDVRTLQLPGRSRERHFFSLGATGSRFSVRLRPQTSVADAQPLDDTAYAVLSQPAPQRVLLVTEGQRYLETALGLDPRLKVEKRTPAGYHSAAGYDVAIFDRFVPRDPPGVPALWLSPVAQGASANEGRAWGLRTGGDPRGASGARVGHVATVSGGGAPYRVVGSIERPFFDEVATDNPVFRSVSLRDVNIRKAARVQLESKDVVLARSKLGPLIVQGERAGQPFIALTFDVRESDLVLRTAWPIFVSQAVRQLTAATGATLEVPMRLGQRESRQVPANAMRAELKTPSGRVSQLSVSDGQISFTPEEAGFYELKAGAAQQLLAANPDPIASAQITARRFAPEPKREQALAGLSQQRDLGSLLLLAAALLLLALDVTRTTRSARG